MPGPDIDKGLPLPENIIYEYIVNKVAPAFIYQIPLMGVLSLMREGTSYDSITLSQYVNDMQSNMMIQPYGINHMVEDDLVEVGVLAREQKNDRNFTYTLTHVGYRAQSLIGHLLDFVSSNNVDLSFLLGNRRIGIPIKSSFEKSTLMPRQISFQNRLRLLHLLSKVDQSIDIDMMVKGSKIQDLNQLIKGMVISGLIKQESKSNTIHIDQENQRKVKELLVLFNKFKEGDPEFIKNGYELKEKVINNHEVLTEIFSVSKSKRNRRN